MLTPKSDKNVRSRLVFNSDQAIEICCVNKLNIDYRKTKWNSAKWAVFLPTHGQRLITQNRPHTSRG